MEVSRRNMTIADAIFEQLTRHAGDSAAPSPPEPLQDLYKTIQAKPEEPFAPHGLCDAAPGGATNGASLVERLPSGVEDHILASLQLVVQRLDMLEAGGDQGRLRMDREEARVEELILRMDQLYTELNQRAGFDAMGAMGERAAAFQSPRTIEKAAFAKTKEEIRRMVEEFKAAKLEFPGGFEGTLS